MGTWVTPPSQLAVPGVSHQGTACDRKIWGLSEPTHQKSAWGRTCLDFPQTGLRLGSKDTQADPCRFSMKSLGSPAREPRHKLASGPHCSHLFVPTSQEARSGHIRHQNQQRVYKKPPSFDELVVPGGGWGQTRSACFSGEASVERFSLSIPVAVLCLGGERCTHQDFSR